MKSAASTRDSRASHDYMHLSVEFAGMATEDDAQDGELSDESVIHVATGRGNDEGSSLKRTEGNDIESKQTDTLTSLKSLQSFHSRMLAERTSPYASRKRGHGFAQSLVHQDTLGSVKVKGRRSSKKLSTTSIRSEDTGDVAPLNSSTLQGRKAANGGLSEKDAFEAAIKSSQATRKQELKNAARLSVIIPGGRLRSSHKSDATSSGTTEGSPNV